ncbi:MULTISPECIES: hypothetical protein [Lactobacillus]|nr:MULTISPECIES: hypothetical protein [Lactobacillus]
MTVLAAMSTKELWSKLWDLLIQKMALDTTKVSSTSWGNSL